MTIPIKPIYLLADSQLLFHVEDQNRFLNSVWDYLETDKPKAAYIGASNYDEPAYFDIFEAAMEGIGIKDCARLLSKFDEADREYLAEADIILLAGGDVAHGWQVMKSNGMDQYLIQRYLGGAVLMGISAGAVQLGLHGWSGINPSKKDLFDCFKLVPYLFDAHDEENDWRRLKRMVRNAEHQVKGIGIPAGGGLLYHPDHTLEPIRKPLVEFTRRESNLYETLLFPPPSKDLGGACEIEPVLLAAANH